jgi:hypothetical protein
VVTSALLRTETECWREEYTISRPARSHRWVSWQAWHSMPLSSEDSICCISKKSPTIQNGVIRIRWKSCHMFIHASAQRHPKANTSLSGAPSAQRASTADFVTSCFRNPLSLTLPTSPLFLRGTYLAPQALSPKWTPLHLPCASWLVVYIGLLLTGLHPGLPIIITL